MIKNSDKKIMISIITINFNNANGLRKTLESVRTQTCQNYEHIIIDGGSTDDSVEVIKEFLNDENYAQHISYWCSEKDNGIYNAMNKGVSHANGDYCLVLNSSDILYDDNTLQNVIPLLDGTDIVSGILVGDNFIKKPDETFTLFSYIDSYVPHGSTFVKTSICKNNPYREDYKIISDYIFFYELLSQKGITYKTINNKIEYFDLSGISTQRPPNHDSELQRFYTEKIPSLAWKDFEVYKELKIINNAIKSNKFNYFIFKVFRKILRPFYG